ncbi:uncharacterized protein LOC126235385 [Schistocerca nitens]|uniref:uncharacterized protein LOC126235385 n=1 Tax=Schistocerca nitens TaxID=7011 RepID=UPI00211779D0|nr:uncharacterized protein LOC126235385 [Schistocerca nitens]
MYSKDCEIWYKNLLSPFVNEPRRLIRLAAGVIPRFRNPPQVAAAAASAPGPGEVRARAREASVSLLPHYRRPELSVSFSEPLLRLSPSFGVDAAAAAAAAAASAGRPPVVGFVIPVAKNDLINRLMGIAVGGRRDFPRLESQRVTTVVAFSISQTRAGPACDWPRQRLYAVFPRPGSSLRRAAHIIMAITVMKARSHAPASGQWTAAAAAAAARHSTVRRATAAAAGALAKLRPGPPAAHLAAAAALVARDGPGPGDNWRPAAGRPPPPVIRAP